MGDIDEACQVIILIGKMMYQAKGVLTKTALTSSQVMSTIYMSKWKGQTSYKRLLKVKGEENGLLFVNIGLENNSFRNASKIRGIEKELERHGIMYARLPDLCGGDGNTQICISARDAKKLEAMLRTHMHGKYKDVPVAEISQFDYTQTGRRADGRPTPELDALKKDAASRRKSVNKKDQRSEPKRKRFARGIPLFGSLFRRNRPAKDVQCNRKPPYPDKIGRQIMMEHDMLQNVGKGGYTWLHTLPLVSKVIDGREFHVMTLPDGQNGIIIPDSWFREPQYAVNREGHFNMRYGALVAENREYYTVNYKDGMIGKMPGKQVVEAARKTPVAEYAKRLEQVLKNEKKQMQIGKAIETAMKPKTPQMK